VAAPTASTALQPSFDALTDLRSSLSRLLEELPGVRRAADVEAVLGLDRPLAWRIFRTATSGTLVEAFQHLPTFNQIRRAVELARREKVAADALDAVERALQRFEIEMNAVADDRAAFAALLCGHHAGAHGALDLRVRKEAFRCNAHLWGAQCRTLIFGAVFASGAPGEAMNAIAARGWIDASSSSPRAPALLLSRFRATHSDGSEPSGGTRVGAMEIVPGFGSTSDYDVATLAGDDGFRESVIRLRGIGRASRTSVFARMHVDAANRPDARAGVAHTPCLPAEALQLDLLVPAGWADPSTSAALAHARPYDVHRAAERRSADQFPFSESPEHFLDTDNVSPTAEAPLWPDVMRHLLTERGWWGRRFDHFRLRVPFPMLHASVTLEVWPRGSAGIGPS